ncbi:MAG: hypothetical protein ACJ76L_02515 [Conexibacter sp.]
MHQTDEDLPRRLPEPTLPSPMVGHRGAPAGAPPMGWGTWILYMLGFPVRRPTAEDEWRRRNS